MFDLDVSDDRTAVVHLARSLALDVVSPAAKAAEYQRVISADVMQTLHNTGLTTLVSESHGGGGVPEVGTHMIAVEGLSYGDPAIALGALWSGAATILIERCGTPAQADTWLRLLATESTARSAVGVYEGFGRSPSESATTITRTSDGGWRVVGRKLAVPFADVATPLIVVGVDPGEGRLRAAILDGEQVKATRDDEKIALGAVPTFTVDFDAAVTDDQLLGGPDAVAEDLELAVGWVRLLVAAAQCGTAQRATDYASKYATERIAFGKPIATFQGVSFMLADSAIRIGVARLEMLDAAAHLDAGLAGSEAVVTRAVNYCSAVATAATRDAIQVLGGHGFITDHPVELWYRSAAALSVLDFDPLLSNFEPSL